jgi:erythromycin esterase-like protein
MDFRARRDDMVAAHIAARVLAEPRLERFIGVIYRPDSERQSHYSRAALSHQFDAWAWFDMTQAVTPLTAGIHDRMPETWVCGW